MTTHDDPLIGKRTVRIEFSMERNDAPFCGVSTGICTERHVGNLVTTNIYHPFYQLRSSICYGSISCNRRCQPAYSRTQHRSPPADKHDRQLQRQLVRLLPQLTPHHCRRPMLLFALMRVMHTAVTYKLHYFAPGIMHVSMYVCLSARISQKHGCVKSASAQLRHAAHLSLTNPCDALHHGKRQNFKTVA